MLIIGLIISVLVSGCLGIYCYRLKTQDKQIVALNAETLKENEQIAQFNQQLKQQRDDIVEKVAVQNNILESLIETSEKMRIKAETQAAKDYQAKWTEFAASYKAEQAALFATYQKRSNALAAQIQQEQEKLNNIEAKQLAYIQAQKRQEEIAANQDYYRLAIDTLDLGDISLLRELQPKFIKKESIDRLIWDVYAKPAYDTLMAHLFEGTKKICGIYKITDLTTGQAYIGQSVDIRERFRQHIKSALSYGKATNRLYQTMQKSGIHNFTFEILEEVPRDKLNERETYWIDFYKTKEFGLNSTRGGS